MGKLMASSAIAPALVGVLGLLAAGVAAFATRADAGGSTLLIACVVAALFPIVALLSKNWWVGTLSGAAVAIVFFVAMILILERVGAAEKMGPAGTAFLFPIFIFIGGTGLGGAVRFLVQAGRQLSGARGEAPFVSKGVLIGAGVAGALVLAWVAWSVGRFAWEIASDQTGRARATDLPAEALSALSGETPGVGGMALVQIWNETDYHFTELTIAYAFDGETTERTLVKPLDVTMDRGDFVILDLAVETGADPDTPRSDTVRWRVTAAKGWR